MDRSKAKEVVEANLGSLKEQLGITHWAIDIDLDLRSNGTYSGECQWLVNYDKAKIGIDVSLVDDGESLVKVLRHELFHIVLSPYTIFHDLIRDLMVDGKTWDAANSVRDHAVERAAINLERMYQCLTNPNGTGSSTASFTPLPTDSV